MIDGARLCLVRQAMAALLIVSGTALADDPPTRVGRIAYLEGTVSFHASPTADWGTAVLNYPVAAATSVWTDDGGRAEIEIGAARIRMDSDTELDIRQLDDQTVQLSVPQGRIDVTLHGARPDEHYDIQTPRGDVMLSPGTFRLFAGTASEATRVAALRGMAEVELGDEQTPVAMGQEAMAGPADPPAYALADAVQDAFDAWAAQRDGTIYARPAPAAAATVPGADSLADYGSWRNVPDYGQVWTPADVPAGWSPYSVGRWAYVAPWGWTWMDAQPWGFAPFHYGRWAAIDGVWSWIPVEPGLAVAPGFVPVYAPALVSFLDTPLDLVAGFGGPAVGWVPLGPGEFWQPWYPVGFEYVRRVNFYNVHRSVLATLTVNNYRSFGAGQALANRQAARVVPAAGFAAGRPVQNTALALNRTGLDRPLNAGAASPLPAPEHSARVAAAAQHAPASAPSGSFRTAAAPRAMAGGPVPAFRPQGEVGPVAPGRMPAYPQQSAPSRSGLEPRAASQARSDHRPPQH
jgi:hypothetical protein